jgi:Glycosyltransferase family 25 (LPS biosynthesis protein)
MSNIGGQALHAYVINLARSDARRAHMVAELAKAGLSYDIVTAIDDRNLNIHDTTKVHPSYLERTDWRPGRVGNGLSHLLAYQQIIADGHERALVLEDDVVLSADVANVADAVAEHLTGAEVALLTFDSETPCELSRDGLVRLPSARALALPIDMAQPIGAAAYVITREACERMACSILPVRAHSDDWSYWYTQGALDRIRCVTPHAVSKSPSFESTIDYNAPSSVKARLVKSIAGNFPLARHAISYRRRRIWQSWTQVELVDKPFIAKPSRLN